MVKKNRFLNLSGIGWFNLNIFAQAHTMKKLFILLTVLFLSSCENPYEDIVFVEIEKMPNLKKHHHNS
jgi:uncharacterized lipoprotein YajG